MLSTKPVCRTEVACGWAVDGSQPLPEPRDAPRLNSCVLGNDCALPVDQHLKLLADSTDSSTMRS